MKVTEVIIIIIIKKDWQCKTGRGRLTPYQSEDPSPTLTGEINITGLASEGECEGELGKARVTNSGR